MSEEMDHRIERPWWRSRRVAIASGAITGLVLVGVLAVAWIGSLRSSVRVPAASVTIDMAQAGVFHDSAVLRAKAAPKDVVYLDTLEGGQVADVLAHAGDVVAAGTPLVRFRNTELELDVLDRVGRLVESITQLQTYEKTLEDTRLANAKAEEDIAYNIVRLTRSAARRDDLAASGVIPAELHEQIHDELDYDRRLEPLQVDSDRRQDVLRRRQLPEIHAELANLRQSLAITRAKLDDLTVRAPVAGRLTDMDLHAGQIKNRGDQLGQIVPNTGFTLKAQVDEYYLDRVRIGQTGDVDLQGKTYPLSVIRVDPEVKDTTFEVELAFTGQQPANLLPGQAFDGRLSLGGDQPAIVLPAGAFLEKSGGDWVFVVEPNGRRADRRSIRIGRRNADQVEVLSGLKPGERVITSDYTGFEKVDRVDLKP
jgi:HlyD family secretion protein